MKICICNLPIRRTPAYIPPFGSMYIIQALKKFGFETEFYNIDYRRPDEKELKEYFTKNQFDIIGISAVVSTGYKYTKYLASLIHSISPKTIVVIGGNLAAASEIILKNCYIDFCVIGEGDITIIELINALKDYSKKTLLLREEWDYEKIKKVEGLCYLDKQKQFCFTGERALITGEKLPWPDYTILENDGSLEYYFQDAESWFLGYGIDIPEGIKGKKCAWLPVAKGCVNRCTFCHRFMKGYRVRPIDQVITHIKNIKDKYNIGVVLMFDEAFGAHRRHASEVASEIGKLGLYWGAGSVRTQSVNKDILKHWYDNGCRMVIYGIESGCQTILNVMEKKCSIQDNIKALKYGYEAGIATTIQMVLGMPGESNKTIDDSIEFLKECLPYYYNEKHNIFNLNMSLFYCQALPGTPVYEYYRFYGYIGKKLEDEENYLLSVSNVDALDIHHFINATDSPLLKVLSWRDKIYRELLIYFFKKKYKFYLTFPRFIREIFLRIFRKVMKILNPRIAKRIKTPIENILNRSEGQIEISFIKIFNMNSFIFFFIYPLKIFSLAFKLTKNPIKIIFYLFEFYFHFIKKVFDNKSKPIINSSLRNYVKIRSAINGSDKSIPLRLGH